MKRSEFVTKLMAIGEGDPEVRITILDDPEEGYNNQTLYDPDLEITGTGEIWIYLGEFIEEFNSGSGETS